MPLYVHTASGEVRRVIPGKGEDVRLAADIDWQRITEQQLAAIRGGKPVAEVLADKPEQAEQPQAEQPATGRRGR